jgi:hypothetical protein
MSSKKPSPAVIPQSEAEALAQGRELIQTSLQTLAQEEVNEGVVWRGNGDV